MRLEFAEALHKEMSLNEDIVVVVADLGYFIFDKIKNDYPDRFYNVQAAEMAAMGVAIGLALEGKKALFYSITPFLLNRPYEMIKLYLEGEGIPVKLIGSGLDDDYKKDGASHHAFNTDKFLDLMPNIVQMNSNNYANMEVCLHHLLHNGKPTFLGLRR